MLRHNLVGNTIEKLKLKLVDLPNGKQTWIAGNATTYQFTGQTAPAPNDLGYAVVMGEVSRSVSVTDADGASQTKTVTFKFSNDINGNLTEVVDMSGNKVRYVYTSGEAGDPYDATPFEGQYGTYYALRGQPRQEYHGRR